MAQGRCRPRHELAALAAHLPYCFAVSAGPLSAASLCCRGCITNQVLRNMRGKVERHGIDAALAGREGLRPEVTVAAEDKQGQLPGRAPMILQWTLLHPGRQPDGFCPSGLALTAATVVQRLPAGAAHRAASPAVQAPAPAALPADWTPG